MRAQTAVLVVAAFAMLAAGGLFLYGQYGGATAPAAASAPVDSLPAARQETTVGDGTNSKLVEAAPEQQQRHKPGVLPPATDLAHELSPAQPATESETGAGTRPADAVATAPAAQQAAAEQARAKSNPAEGTGTIRGQVLLDESPLQGASVSLNNAVDDSTIATAFSDENGAFMFENIAVGDVTVAAVFSEATADSQDPRIRHVNVPVVVERGQITPVWIRSNSSDATIEGTVFVEGVPATDFGVSGWVFTESGTEDVIFNTGPDGTFEHAGLPPGRVKVQARVWGDRDSGDQRVLAKEVDLAPGATEIVDFNFENGGVIYGTVANIFPNGNNGLAIYEGHLPPSDPKQMTPEEFYNFHQTMKSNVYLYDNPQFRTENIPAGDYTISAYSIPSSAREAAAFREGRYDVQYITLTNGQEMEMNFDLK